MTSGFKISLPGKETTSTDIRDLAVDSQYPSPKISSLASPAHFGVLNYTFSFDPPDGTTNLVTIPHGYGFTPDSICFFVGFFGAGGALTPLRMAPIVGENQNIVSYTDGTNFKIDYICDNFSSVDHLDVTGIAFLFRYYIFAASGQTYP